MANGSVAALETTRRHRFSVDDYHRLGAAEMLPPDHERFELIDGEILVTGPIGVRHANCVDRLGAALSGLGPRAVVRVQGPLRLDDHSEPLPDLMLLAPPLAAYAERPPAPADVLLLVEVADASLAFDRREKLPRYANSGIPEVWLVDLVANRVEAHREPAGDHYRETRTAARGGRIAPASFPHLTLSADDLLPWEFLRRRGTSPSAGSAGPSRT